MRLKSISLKNIRSYENETISFPSGSLLLSGDIGCGKSTILQAVEFALFGTQRGTLEASGLLRKGCKNAEVSLTFDVDDKTYTVKRSLKGSQQGSGYIIVNGVREDLMPTELKSRLMTLLGYPISNIFRYSVYASQEQMKQIIVEKPEVRLDTLRAIFGIDKYKTIVDNAQVVLKNLRKESQYKEGQISSLPEKKKALSEILPKIELVDKRKHKVGKELSEKRELLLKSEKEYKEASEEVKKFELKQKDLDNSKARVKDINEEIEQISNNKTKTKFEIEGLQKEYDDLKIEDKGNYEKVVSDIESQSELINRNKNLKESLNEKKDLYLEQLKNLKVEDLSEKLNEVNSELEIIEVKLNVLEKKQKELREHEKLLAQKNALLEENSKREDSIKDLDVCPTCLQKVDDSHKTNVNEKFMQSVKVIKDEIGKLNFEIEALSKECDKIDEIQLKKQDLVKTKIELEQLNSQVSKNKEIKSDLEEKLTGIESKLKIVDSFNFEESEKKLKALKEKESELKKVEILKQKKEGWLKLIEEKKNFLRDLHEKEKILNESLSQTNILIKNLQNELKQVDKIIDASKLKEELLNKAKQIFDKIAIEFEGIRKDEEHFQQDKQKLEKELQELLKIEKNVEWNKQMQSWLTGFFIKLMNTIEKRVFLQIYHEFNVNFSDWFDILIEDDSMKVTIDEQFTPKITQNGYDIDVSALSGGERTSVALAYRLALNKIVNELIPNIKTSDLLILDEPTEGFSTEQLDRVREVLDLLKVDQLIMVSHEPKMDSFVDNVLRVEKVQNVSRVF